MDLVTFEAGADLSAKQYYFVDVSSDGQVDPAGDGLFAIGVLQNTPAAAGRAATVCVGGITKVACGGTITIGNPVASDSAGKAVACATNDVILGEALETGASGNVIAILFHPRAKAASATA